MKTKLLIGIALLSLSLINLSAQNFFPKDIVEQNLSNFATVNGQWNAINPYNNTLGANFYQGINFGYDRNNYASLINGIGFNELYFGRWAWGWQGWSRIWHSNNLNKADIDFTAKKYTAQA